MRIRLRPMSLHELDHASGQVSVAGLLAGETATAVAPQIDTRRLAELICLGGWPRHVGLAAEAGQDLLVAYLEETARVDFPAETGTSHDPVKVRRLLRSLARHVSTTASQASLARDSAGDGARLNHQTGGHEPEVSFGEQALLRPRPVKQTLGALPDPTSSHIRTCTARHPDSEWVLRRLNVVVFCLVVVGCYCSVGGFELVG